jgi:hypothetical protein
VIEIFDTIEQGTPEWYRARMGIPTASEFAAVITPGKTKAEAKTRRTYMLKLAGELFTGDPMDSVNTRHMERGKIMEDEARDLYCFMADAEAQRVGFHPPHLAAAPLQQPDAADDVGHLDAVGADVLDRGRTGRAGDSRQALQAAEPVGQRRHDHVVPRRTRLGAHDVVVDRDLGVVQPHDRQVGEVVGDDDVGATAKDQGAFHRVTGGEFAQDGDDVVGGVTGEDPAGNGSEPQRGHGRDGDGHRHLDATDIRTDHGR